MAEEKSLPTEHDRVRLSINGSRNNKVHPYSSPVVVVLRDFMELLTDIL